MPTSVEVAFLLPILAVLSLLAYRIRTLDASGTAVAIVVGLISFYAGGWKWFGVLIFFFLVSSLLTRYRYAEKRSLGCAQDKEGARGWRNVLANGGIPIIFSLNEVAYGGDLFVVGFLGAIAATFADTLGTEVGLLSKNPPRSIIPPFKVAMRGESGAVSALGLLAGFAGALSFGLISVVAGLVNENPFTIIFAILVGGFSGTLFDSLLGSTVQGAGECVVCGKGTELLTHHDQPTRHLKGIRFFENNMVNFVSTALGALVTSSIFIIL